MLRISRSEVGRHSPRDQVIRSRTGAVTQALLQRGIAPGRLTVVESSLPFVRHLRARFPDVTVLEGSAAVLGGLLPNGRQIEAIVSSLPLRSLPARGAAAIVAWWGALVGSGGIVVQFGWVPGTSWTDRSCLQAGATPFWDALQRSKDPTTYTALAEDSAALVGLAVGAAGTALSHRLSMPELEGAASLVIGLLLADVAVALIRESHRGERWTVGARLPPVTAPDPRFSSPWRRCME